MFGATAASASLAKLNHRQIRHALSYTGQQASGITSWVRGAEDVQKAFVFAGMGARNGVTSTVFVLHGFTGEEDIFADEYNFLEVFCPGRDQLPKWLDNLGSRYDVMLTNIKKFRMSITCRGDPPGRPRARRILRKSSGVPGKRAHPADAF